MDYKTTNKDEWYKLKPFARANRRAMTLPEKILWLSLRKNQLGIKFRRQQIIAGFIADFANLDHKLIIEVDGPSHKDQKEYDEMRTNVLCDLGYRIVRFSNDDISGNCESVIERLKAIIEELKT